MCAACPASLREGSAAGTPATAQPSEEAEDTGFSNAPLVTKRAAMRRCIQLPPPATPLA